MKTLRAESRSLLQAPFGKLFSGPSLPPLAGARFLIAVGDATAFALLESGITPNVSIVDGLAQRKPIAQSMRERIRAAYSNQMSASNPAGHLSDEAEAAVKEAIAHAQKSKKPVLLEISGEEDLLFLPALLAAPEGSVILYGQPNVGMVEVVANEKEKQKIREILAEAFD